MMHDIKTLRMIEARAPHLLTVEDRMILRRDDMHREQWWHMAKLIGGVALTVAMAWGFIALILAL